MKKNIKSLKFASILLLTALLFPLTSCGGDSNSQSNGGVKVNQVVNVKVFDTFVIPELEVELFDNQNNLVGSGLTDDNGVATIEVSSFGEYVIKIGDETPGFYVDGEFKTSASGEEVSVNCKTQLIEGKIPNNTIYKEGSVIHDFSVTTTNGDVIKASDYLKDHNAIFLNYWATWCGPCVGEFPYVEQASKSYDDEVAFIAVSIDDTMRDIAEFKASYGLTFDMGIENDSNLSVALQIAAFPTTVIIDRYGIVESIHVGAVNSILDLDLMFSNVLSEDYVPSIVEGALVGSEGEDDRVKPNVTMPDSSVIEDAVNGEGYTFSYYPETNPEEAEYSWPWVVSDDGVSINPSNYTIDSSYSIIYSDFSLAKNKALAFDYKSSTEADCDILYVLIDGVIQAVISGETDGWQTCYPYVALSAGKHTLAMIYMKDESSSVGDDTVYVKNMRVIDSEDIAHPTYILRECFKGQSQVSGKYLFVNPVYNEEDGYYHAEDANGPLIMANLLNSTLWSDYTILDYAQNGYLENLNGVSYTDLIIKYAGYATNGGMDLVPVTQELKEALVAISIANPLIGDAEKEWMLMCNYYSAYGTNGEELQDPIAGLAPFSAYEATLGENLINFSSTIVPRGKYSRFIPETSGVYKITTEKVITGDSTIDASLQHATTCWLFDEEMNLLTQGVRDGRVHFETEDHDNFIIYYYLEAGETYYVNCAFEDLYRYTDLKFIISYVGESYDYLRACTPPAFTTDSVDINGMPSGNIIHGGIEAAIGEDGYYHHLNNDELDSIIYCDFIYVTEVFNYSILDMIEMGGFDFTVNDDGNVVEGEDLTEEIAAYQSKMILDTESELFGMVPVDARLAEILQLLLDKYTFKGVYQCWLKVCYYYEHHGA